MNLNRFLTCTAAGIFILIIFLTGVFYFTAGKKKSDKTALTQENTAPFIAKKKSAFTKLGQMRIDPATDKTYQQTLVIVTPVLEYPADDKAFYEELDSKTGKIKEIIINYFSCYTILQLTKKGEDNVKVELLEEINSILVLQKIETLYFYDYQFL